MGGRAQIKLTASQVIMRKYSLEIIVFITGAAVMILEIAGSRVLAPYAGTSVIAWTSLIGIILASLSAGYALGGRLADRYPSREFLSLILFAGGALTGGAAIMKGIILGGLFSITRSVYLISILGTLTLFALPSLILGMVSPFALRLRFGAREDSGRTAGNLYALSTLGSIIGTFAAGFYLLPAFGHRSIILGTGIALILLSLFTTERRLRAAGAIIILVFLAAGAGLIPLPQEKLGITDVDSAYQRLFVREGWDKGGRLIHYLMTDFFGTQSAAYADGSPEIIFPYIRFFRLGSHFVPRPQRALMIGGGGLTYPRDFALKEPQAKMDVAEIDPRVTALASTYFNFSEEKNVEIFHEDGRTFLNRAPSGKYDLVFMDAFRSFTPPPQLVTKEAMREIERVLKPRGVLVTNMIGALAGEKGEFPQTVLRTYKSVFPDVYVFAVDTKKTDTVQNLLLVAAKNKLDLVSADPEITEYLDHEIALTPAAGPIFTDDWAPVEYLVRNLLAPES